MAAEVPVYVLTFSDFGGGSYYLAVVLGLVITVASLTKHKLCCVKFNEYLTTMIGSTGFRCSKACWDLPDQDQP